MPNDLELVKQSIAHWKRMIQWVETQPDTVGMRISALSYTMQEAIDESWYSDHCPLCNEYNDICDECPLAKHYGSCVGTVGDNAWQGFSDKTSWKTWLPVARKMLRQLKTVAHCLEKKQ